MQPPWSLNPVPSDPLPERADVVVVGASPAGLQLALDLARSGARVAVLEGRTAVGQGCSGRDPGVLTGGLPEHPWRLIHSIGGPKTAEIYRLSARTRELLDDLGSPRTPAVHVGIDEREPQELARSIEALSGIGLPARPLSSAELTQLGRGFTAGMAVAGEGAIDTECLIGALATAAGATGVHVCTNAEVRGVSRVADDHVIDSTAGVVRTSVLAWCAGHPLRALDPWFADKLLPVREHALRFEGSLGPIPAGKAQYGYVQWRQDAAGGLRISGCRWATQHLEMGETVEAPLDLILDKIEAFAHRHFDLGDASISHRWARILTATCDGLPILGPMPGDPTIVACTGFQGFGPALGPACGAGVAEGLLTGRSPLPDWMSPRRFL